MNKRDLLLEVGLEEMPARYIQNSIRSLEEKTVEWFKSHKIGFDDITSFSTPRRLALFVKGVAESQEDTVEEAKGPAKKIALDDQGNWSKAAIGFTRGQGMTPEDIYFTEINGVEYAHVKKFSKGQETMRLLPELADVITGLHFPKSMRWGSHDLRYIRPIHWIVALFGSDLVPFSIAGVETSRTTRGHRFLGEEISLIAPEDYVKALLGQYVIADAEERKQAILEQIRKMEQENNWVIPIEEELLEEVTNLVEYPTVFSGSFNEEFLKLPQEVLVTSMKVHQRYFPVKDDSGYLLPIFIGVRNGDHRHLENVVRGNEKVLRARLADGVFFYEEDQKMQIADALKKLENIVYHEQIGTLSQKVGRIRKVAALIASELNLSEQESAWIDRASEISKFDLVTNMVGEFPELQGVIGEKYALQKGEEKSVAVAINEHYQPRFAGDAVPASTIGAVVAAADKLDTIVSSFAIGLIPSGSQDPYALRRQAAGVVQIFAEMQWNFDFEDMLEKVIELNAVDIQPSIENVKLELTAFFKMRIKHVLQAKEIRYDLTEAVLSGNVVSIPAILEKADVLQSHKDDEDFKEVIEALARIINISSKATENTVINESLFQHVTENRLYARYEETVKCMEEEKDMSAQYRALASLEPDITAFFEHNMVMDKNEEIKNNRLALVKAVANMIVAFADMNEVHVK